MLLQVKGWVMGRNKRREWINRDWVEWYYRDRERQVKTRSALDRQRTLQRDATSDGAGVLASSISVSSFAGRQGLGGMTLVRQAPSEYTKTPLVFPCVSSYFEHEDGLPLTPTLT